MTENGQFLSVPDFRENATEEDYQELYNFYQTGTKNFPTRKEPKPDCRFQFGATSAKELLTKWIQKKGPSQEESHEPVRQDAAGDNATPMFDDAKKDFTKRSVLMTDANWDRLQAIYDRYASRSKHYVLDALLTEITQKYAD